MKSWYDIETDVLHVDFGKGDVKAFTSEFLKDIAFTHNGKGAYESQPFNVTKKVPGLAQAINKMMTPTENQKMNEQLNNMFKEAKEKAERSARIESETKAWFNYGDLVACKPFNSIPKNMKRLTTYNDWTILLENDKLVAIDSRGNTVRAIGSLISAGGKAWMWRNGNLWSGELTQMLTEEQEVQNIKFEAKQKVFAKFDKKFEAVEKKQDALREARDKELCSL